MKSYLKRKTVTIMSSFFINFTIGVKLKEDNESNAKTSEDVLDTFNFHPSIERIFISVSTGRFAT